LADYRLPTLLAGIACSVLAAVMFSVTVVAALLAFEMGPTEDPESSVVELRNKLKEIAFGTADSVSGSTLPNECYVLLYGYHGPRPVDQLPVSPALRSKLHRLTPGSYERYVLVRAIGDEVQEYTQWESGDQPQLPVPLLIRGDPFTITTVRRDHVRVWIDIR
jgi:hypothetical protein